MTKPIYKKEKEILENYESDPRYLEYKKLIRQYLEIKNDDEKLKSKFNEIITQLQKLVGAGIIDF